MHDAKPCEWTGGVWYDPAYLPAKSDEKHAYLTNLVWDVIVKSYDAEKDAFTFTRISTCGAAANFAPNTDKNYRRVEDRLVNWKFYTKDGEKLPANSRVVAIMPHPDWKFIYETRLHPASMGGLGLEPTDAQ